MTEFVIGDIHGGYKSLLQCLKRSNFNYKEDKLICLGDVADGWTETYKAVEELLKIKNLVYVRGNHDQWLKDWLKEGKRPDVWTLQGGLNTLKSYLKESTEDWKRHLKFFKETRFYYVDDKNRCFVHGGVSQNGMPIEACDKMFLCWDRELWDNKPVTIPEFKEVYVGHTSIHRVSSKPIAFGNVWFMDTGAGWEGKLSIMNINTKEIFQSDLVTNLYPDVRGRSQETRNDYV